jgi:hypothetical protein
MKCVEFQVKARYLVSFRFEKKKTKNISFVLIYFSMCYRPDGM